MIHHAQTDDSSRPPQVFLRGLLARQSVERQKRPLASNRVPLFVPNYVSCCSVCKPHSSTVQYFLRPREAEPPAGKENIGGRLFPLLYGRRIEADEDLWMFCATSSSSQSESVGGRTRQGRLDGNVEIEKKA